MGALMRTTDKANTEARRKHVMLAAMRCFAKLGLQNTSVKDICREAGMTAGHLYYYFANKSAIIESLFEVGTSEIMGRIEHMLDSDDLGNAIVNLHNEAESKRDEWSMSPGLRLEFFAEAARNDELRKIQQDLDARTMSAVSTAVRRAIATGRLASETEPESFARAIILLWDGLGIARAGSGSDLPAFERAIMALIKPWLITAKGAKKGRVLTNA
jgi:TetR/AcrR family transcriptional repressor of uid operon